MDKEGLSEKKSITLLEKYPLIIFGLTVEFE